MGPGQYPQYTRAWFAREAVGSSQINPTAPTHKPNRLHGTGKPRMVAERTVQEPETEPEAESLDDEQFLVRAACGPTAESLASLEGKTHQQWFGEQMTLPVESHRALYGERSADEVFYAVCPTKGEAIQVTVYENDHKEEILQSDDETMKKEIINEDSTLMSIVPNLKAPSEGFGSKERRTV